ncbi:cytochrome c5 family protein [Moraxella catarrhalis]|uniref:c-type cytochrome n=1 Tax=Moraxella catarrhalis TaxID=480 RepID=UPI0007E4BAC0|nr:c-type cytochrome [Moraxella catarrhalis]MPW64880.1 cytochrome c5 family protein [Moraxella catarrhalis]MPW73907.1 cytochrome c5 family protein [Moraxella catarrhalis]OAV08147.1 cytochrome c class I [Moraxella catarrhalis]OAV11530.1 cytochrome c class I [Moraxella catarrhalis]OAV12570.1 cytochrome c class I [Moraxella catarrhalis]
MMTMKKAVMFSVAALLAVSTMATQAQEAAAPAETQTADATEVTEVTTAEATVEAPAQAAAPAEEAPKESPQVQKLVAMYPNLIARIAPYGKVCFDGEECDINITVLAPAVEGQARDGESLYKAICSTCHDAGLIGAPKIGTSDWASRIGKGTATLYNHAINGFNAMPARGGADISDEEVQNAVDYIIQQSS